MWIISLILRRQTSLKVQLNRVKVLIGRSGRALHSDRNSRYVRHLIGAAGQRTYDAGQTYGCHLTGTVRIYLYVNTADLGMGDLLTLSGLYSGAHFTRTATTMGRERLGKTHTVRSVRLKRFHHSSSGRETVLPLHCD